MKKNKIFLLGQSGKMGQEIAKLIDQDKNLSLEKELAKAEVIVDFTNAEAFSKNLKLAVKNKKPFVCGTTGLDSKQTRELAVAAKQIPLLWAPNMSLGVCVLNQMLKSLKSLQDYDFYVEETHHAHKKDAPSGTALQIQKNLETAIQKKVKNNISLRGGGVFGQHRIIVLGPEETLTIQHDALNRTVFARGALTCAKWILNKKNGNYTIEDVLT